MVRGRAIGCGRVGAAALLAASVIGCDDGPPPPIEELVDYQRDVQPILAEHCFGCHGPDAATRAAGLRLDTFEDATADRGGGRFAIAPRDPDASLAIQRIEAVEPSPRMPPAPNDPLADSDIATLRRWIAQGAAYGRHWAFEPIAEVTVPGGASHPMDAFVEARLGDEGITPAPRAEPAVLVRRLSLDLRGLPPSPEELDAFVADPSDAAYEALVDRWLASPAHAERLALDWMDYAGYGDSNGLHADDPRTAWPWRDWVIAQFLANRPLDEMIVAQVAGDLLPSATEEDVLATGFLRHHVTTGEGGVDPEERRFLHSMDRARLVGTQLFGLTVHCAQCHDHKYDPISQRDFYSLIACFDRVADRGLVTTPDTEVPTLAVTSPLWPARRAEIVARLAVLDARLAEDDVTRAASSWEASLAPGAASFVVPDDVLGDSLEGRASVDVDGTLRPRGAVPIGDTLTITIDHDAPIHAIRLELGEGRSLVLPRLTEVTVDREAEDARARVTLVRASFDDDGSDASAVIDGHNTTGIELPTPRAITLVPSAPIGAGERLVLRVDQRFGTSSVFGSLRVLVSSDARAIVTPAVRSALDRPAIERTDAERAEVRALFVEAVPSSPAHDEALEARALRAELARGDAPVRTRVMREDDPDRRTRILSRGQWASPAEEVRCAVPAALRIDHPVEVANRLELARFVVGETNPITLRVLANHYFQLLVGTSLVATPDDWGTRGGTPAHRALLDWLATSLRNGHWDLRAYLRMIVLSETYRRSSTVSPELALADPTNALLSRGVRRRLEAELVRDGALVAAGLLAPSIGGPPAFVSHPDGLYEATGDGLGAITTYPVDRAPRAHHRRALYTFWRRSAPHPSMALFDAPDRIHAVARREETSTPTQALALWNDPHFVEAARVMATRARRAHPADPDAQIEDVFRRVLARPPTEAERALLRASYDAERAELEDAADDADALLTIGDADVARDASLDDAALTHVARAVLSTSESITRE
ncbi:MAG: PSD1 domain-containing protein [Deltaproteobacteria bacterium]|nr:PSD1 domain-containing protein [Deltaproteobacteria bacterium]